MIKKPQLRRDAVSGDWVLIAPGRRSRPDQFRKHSDAPQPTEACPFEEPASTNKLLSWYDDRGLQNGAPEASWKVQVIENKYPAVSEPHGTCPLPPGESLHGHMDGIGFHEVVVTRSHTESLGAMSTEEVTTVLRAYQDRFRAHRDEECLRYILIFHNHGTDAGASVYHPHSQVMALPIVPPDVRRSLEGSKKNWEESKKCIHCEYIAEEQKTKERFIYENKDFVVLAPFASHVNFEVRIFPLVHSSDFATLSEASLSFFADALSTALKKLKNILEDPPYNFFIHTSPLRDGNHEYYHWHLEILPKTGRLAGVELGTGIEVITMEPELAAEYLRNA